MTAPPFDRVVVSEGLRFLHRLGDESAHAAFFDPQYREHLDRMNYGNEGKQRGQRRAALQAMSDSAIGVLIGQLSRVLKPSGHLFVWADKYQMVQGSVRGMLLGSSLEMVDFVNWHKNWLGMGYRTRQTTEYLFVLQKKPKTTKNWTSHDIPDTWTERADRTLHPHAKPVQLQRALIEAVTEPDDIVVDPAAGSGSVLLACRQAGRRFLGCDLLPRPVPDKVDKVL